MDWIARAGARRCISLCDLIGDEAGAGDNVLRRRGGGEEGRCVLILSLIGKARFLNVILFQMFDLLCIQSGSWMGSVNAYMNAVLFEIADPSLQGLFFRLSKPRLRVAVGHKIGRTVIIAQTLYSSVQAWNGSATRVCSSFDTASCNCPCSTVSACNPRKAIRRDAPSSTLKPASVPREAGCHPGVRMILAEDKKMRITGS